MSQLAALGGVPTAPLQWPTWPRSSDDLESAVIDTLRSGRWTISGTYRGRRSEESRFAQAFADYVGVRFGVPTCNGTHALVTALEALDVGPGDEVLVPGLTWVADATAVINLNATPILVDVDDSLCISPDAIRRAITPRTKAIIAVHLYCSMPDWDAIMSVADEHGLPVVEDAAQAHGAAWRGRRSGSIGRIGAFSFQQSKLLTCGEGGIAVTDDEHLYERMKRIRCDGRDYVASPVVGQLELDESRTTPLMGTNYCLSDISAAVLQSRLPHLDSEIQHRLANVAYLEPRLGDVPGVEIVPARDGVTTRPIWQLALRVDRAAFADAPLESIVAALTAEVAIGWDRADPPLNASHLYRPHTKRRFQLPDRPDHHIDPSRFDLPQATREYERLLLIQHPAFLGDSTHMDGIIAALKKVQSHALELGRVDA